jgi:hypothetical protein
MLEFKKKDFAKVDTSKFARPLGKNRIIVPQLDKAFKEFDGRFVFTYEPKKEDTAWHPSGDCIPGPLALWEKATGLIERGDLSSLNKTFMVGHYWHQIIQHLLVINDIAPASSIEREGIDDWSDLEYVDETSGMITHIFAPYHWVHGAGDIVPFVGKDWSGLIDIKTMGSHAFNAPGLPSNFADKYIAQVNIYMHLFDVEQALFLCVNKDNSAFKEITFVRNQPLIDAILLKWKFVADCIDRDIIVTEEDDIEYALPTINKDESVT